MSKESNSNFDSLNSMWESLLDDYYKGGIGQIETMVMGRDRSNGDVVMYDIAILAIDKKHRPHVSTFLQMINHPIGGKYVRDSLEEGCRVAIEEIKKQEKGG